MVSTLKDDYNVRAFENIIMKTVERKRDEVTGGLRKIHNKGLYNLYSAPSIISMIKSKKN